MALFDLKNLNSALEDLQQERGISRESALAALETGLAAAYRREYGKRGQIIRAKINAETGDVEFRQAKIVVDKTLVRMPEEEDMAEDEAKAAEGGFAKRSVRGGSSFSLQSGTAHYDGGCAAYHARCRA